MTESRAAMRLAPSTATTAPVRLALGAAVLSVLLQSLGPIFIREAGLGGLAFAFYRMWIAAAVYTAITYATGNGIGSAQLRASLPGGLMFAFNVATFFLAVGHTSIANATVISALQPVALLLVTNRLFGERARATDVFWSFVSIGGVALVVFGSVSAKTSGATGDVLAFLAMLGYAGYYVASKQARRTLGALEYQASLSIVASLALTPFVFLSGERLGASHPTDWVWVVAMVAIPGTGHLLTNYAHPFLRLSVLSLLTLLVPVGSTLLAWVWLGEKVSLVQATGIAVVIAALSVVITSTNRAAIRVSAASSR